MSDGQPPDLDEILGYFLARVAEDRAGPVFLGWMTEFNGNGDPIPLEMWRHGDQVRFRPSPHPFVLQPHPPHGDKLGDHEQAEQDSTRQRDSTQG